MRALAFRSRSDSAFLAKWQAVHTKRAWLSRDFVEWRRKPISFVGWGNVGGARAIEQLRLVAVEFEMAIHPD